MESGAGMEALRRRNKEEKTMSRGRRARQEQERAKEGRKKE